MDLLDRPPTLWVNQDIVLFHGTTLSAAESIVRDGISLRFGQLGRDFGQGFYTTTVERQARQWARKRQIVKTILDPQEKAAIVELRVGRHEIARLEFIAFVEGDDRADDFWSLVHYCRRGATDHGRIDRILSARSYYDVVFGPVAGDWEQNLTIPGDQVSFHTPASEEMLNKSARKRIIEL